MNDMVNCFKSRVEHFRQTFQRIRAGYVPWKMSLAFIKSTDLSDLFIGEFRARISRPCIPESLRNERPAIFRDCIILIVLRSAYKKMIWANASGIIAAMKNMRLRRYFAEVQLPGKSMRADFCESANADTQRAVTKGSFCTRPKPTLLSLFDTTPKALLCGWAHDGRTF
jgi:hypothetical protein